ncbi:hypothetical protein [Thermaerobacillus caldiproteolyticus]|uniref:Uncharacterized protein n=1 Tax=Thermaerobacillus caldiproteolyticus TaxID=247480 RepID=A0A7W0C0E7_9BACL|nr:hypothetical protein [Anoxybacillus caldiproteolyticus]MBA2875199.1 hypothetical protein [Anoxybacillus caldiproteolyticus]
MKKTQQNRSGEQQYKDRQQEKDMEQQPGYGDKKLEGPNRPAE